MKVFLLLICIIKISTGKNHIIASQALPTPILIAKNGYPNENYLVITEDCYILEMHRIPHGQNDFKRESRPPVLVLHGILESSSDWVLASPKRSLGFMLADAGFDVWLGNMRGNTYGKRHCYKSPTNEDFWNFSVDHVGTYDIPAMIDRIRNITGQDKIFFIGFSMGTTAYMIMANQKPEYQQYIQLANLMAPVAYVDHMKSPLRFLSPFINQLDWVFKFLGQGEFYPSIGFTDWIASSICDKNMFKGICSNFVFVITGHNKDQIDYRMLETIMKHVPAGTSTNVLVHYGQEINSKRFCAFDHGEENIRIYGQETPPEYDLKKVTSPVALYWSDSDWLTHTKH